MRSPCTDICLFDGRTGWCRGCGRTKVEARRWKNASPGDLRKLSSELPQRLRKLQDRERPS
jgi:predicted Fe-S protein YdhL (DUF1289 family)